MNYNVLMIFFTLKSLRFLFKGDVDACIFRVLINVFKSNFVLSNQKQILVFSQNYRILNSDLVRKINKHSKI